MALRETIVKETGHNGLQFPEHDLTHRLLDGLVGLELGPSSHNSYGLDGSRSVAPADDFAFYKGGQVDQNGKYVEIDIFGEADSIPVEDDSQHYVLSSHVFEHIPDPISALLEWYRVITDRGYIDMIVPQRDALESDRARPLSTYEEWKRAYDEGWTPEKIPQEVTLAAGGHRGHYWVYTSNTLKAMIEAFAQEYLEPNGGTLALVEEEDPDKKVGNGFCLVYRVIKPRQAPPVPAKSEVEPEPELEPEKPVRKGRKKASAA